MAWKGPSLFCILLLSFSFLWWECVAFITKGGREGKKEDEENEKEPTVIALSAAVEQGIKEKKEKGRKRRKIWSYYHQMEVGPFSRVGLDYPERVSHHSIILMKSL